MIPSSFSILDAFGRPDGGLGGNWINALGLGGCQLSGGVAKGTLAGSGQASAWAVPMGSGVAIFCRLAVLPTGFVVKLILSPDPVGGTPQVVATYDQTGTLAISCIPGSGTGSVQTLNPGDWFGLGFDGTTVTAMKAVNGAGFTTTVTTSGAAVPAPSGFYAILNINDNAAAVSAFGALALPGADVTTPLVHGRGAA